MNDPEKNEKSVDEVSDHPVTPLPTVVSTEQKYFMPTAAGNVATYGPLTPYPLEAYAMAPKFMPHQFFTHAPGELKPSIGRKRTQRIDPVPQSGFKGVSWNSRMRAWLAFYVNENGRRKSKTFSAKKLGMDEARLQAIAFCKQQQDMRSARRSTTRDSGGGVNITGDEAEVSAHDQHQSVALDVQPSQVAVRPPHVAYVPIVPIQMDLVMKSGLLEPLEATMLPPCQHCGRQPYPSLMIVAEGSQRKEQPCMIP